MLGLGFKISEKTIEETINSKSELKTYEIEGERYHPENSVFKIPYKITNSKIESMKLDSASASLIINLKETTSDGILEISIPRNLIDSIISNGQDDEFFILINGEETKFTEPSKSPCFRNLLIEFPETTNEIEIIASFIYSYPISKVPDECIDKTIVKS